MGGSRLNIQPVVPEFADCFTMVGTTGIVLSDGYLESQHSFSVSSSSTISVACRRRCGCRLRRAQISTVIIPFGVLDGEGDLTARLVVGVLHRVCGRLCHT